MNACPSREQFYSKIGGTPEQREVWLGCLEKQVAVIKSQLVANKVTP
jgi:hypothetical protein